MRHTLACMYIHEGIGIHQGIQLYMHTGIHPKMDWGIPEDPHTQVHGHTCARRLGNIRAHMHTHIHSNMHVHK